uniref:Uncharacterized protein n=1 Tax=Setaria viridis TaxID=4556 RepID=A0A4U6T6Q3_SETVI|nr:hypothetical protein SEVIR_9G496650v2 [Setaria viridis]
MHAGEPNNLHDLPFHPGPQPSMVANSTRQAHQVDVPVAVHHLGFPLEPSDPNTYVSGVLTPTPTTPVTGTIGASHIGSTRVSYGTAAPLRGTRSPRGTPTCCAPCRSRSRPITTSGRSPNTTHQRRGQTPQGTLLAPRQPEHRRPRDARQAVLHVGAEDLHSRREPAEREPRKTTCCK